MNLKYYEEKRQKKNEKERKRKESVHAKGLMLEEVLYSPLQKENETL